MSGKLAQNFVLIKQWQVQKHKELKKILQMEAAGGICMLLFAVLALVIYNSPLSDWYNFFINEEILIGFGPHIVSIDLKSFTGEVLLILFFAAVCMQLKRDLEQELLDQKKQILLPAFTAMGGMLCPAIIYTILNWHNPETAHGWGIPISTDSAFAIAVLLALGRSLPRAVKVFMLATAIFDDIGSIFIIALFYSTDISIVPLLGVFCGCLLLFIMNRANIVYKLPYILICIIMFFFLHYAGIETTLAGVLLGLSIPLADKDDLERFPLKELLDDIQPIVSFFVLPLFAFVNAGVAVLNITAEDLTNSVTLGVFLGLFIGKQIGIFGISYLLIKLKIFKMPKNLNFSYLYGISIIGGIGFTMSIFIGTLTFSNNERLLEDSIVGTLMSSLLASIFGCIYLFHIIIKQKRVKKQKEEQKLLEQEELKEAVNAV